MALSEESLLKIKTYMDTHNPSDMHNILGQILLSGILNGKEMFSTVKEGEYHIFAESAWGYNVYAFYKDSGNIYCIKCGFSGAGYSVYGYCPIDNADVFDEYMF